MTEGWWGWVGGEGEGGEFAVGDQEPGGGGVDVEVGQVVLVEFGQGVPGEVAGVFGVDGEVDLGAGVRGDRGLGLAGELGEVLVGQDEAEPEAAGFGEHVVDAAGQVEEVVAFVDVQGGVAASVFGMRGAGDGGLPGPGHDQGAEDPGGVLPEDPLR